MKNTLKKKTNHVFGKDIYLLGQDKWGINYWLEAPSFDCGWYWGFGYVETYTNNNSPHKSKDISSHQHVKGFLLETSEENIYNSPNLSKTTFSKEEGLRLTMLFKEFYSLSKEAEVKKLTDVDRVSEVNKSLIPNITSEILSILS